MFQTLINPKCQRYDLHGQKVGAVTAENSRERDNRTTFAMENKRGSNF